MGGNFRLAAVLDEAEAEDLLHATPVHDVGKIGIPGAILHQPGKLDDTEWKAMREHSRSCAEIIGVRSSCLPQIDHNIALFHLEKWGGSG